MSRENLEIVRQLIDAWNRGDVDGWLELVHPDGEWSSAILRQVEGDEAASFRGHLELRRFWDEWHEVWALTVEPSEIRDLGETIVVLGDMHTRGSKSGVDLDREVGYVMELEDGLVRRSRAYFSAEAALEAAGLPK
jgi:ketosteroid isomerase-like protein